MINVIKIFSLRNLSLLATLLLLYSCTDAPTAGFSYTPFENLEIGDTIYFENESENSNEFEWYFGDGDSTDVESPMKIYEYSGYFKVILNALNKSGFDTISQIVDVNNPTVLGFFIFEPDSVTVIPDCNVWVYSDSANFYDGGEPDFTALTDSDGIAAFENLEDITYYVSIFKETEDGLYIREGFTKPLDLFTINLYAIVMQFVEGGSMESAMQKELNGKSNQKSLLPALDKEFEVLPERFHRDRN